MSSDAGRAHRYDAVVALWVALWLVVGAWTTVEVWRLSDVTTTVAHSGEAIDRAGSALQSLRPVPVVGGNVAELGDQVVANGQEVVRNAGQAHASFRRLAVLLGFALALIPSVPVVLLHLHVRRSSPVPTPIPAAPTG